MQSFNKNLMLSYSDVLGQLKFNKHLTGIDLSCEQRIKELIAESTILLEPKGFFETFKIVSKTDSSVELDTFGVIESSSIASLLENCSDVVMFVVTVGSKIYEKTKFFSENKNVFKALVFDAIGSVAVEQSADEINEIVTMQAKLEGLKTTRRFSAGYGDFSVEKYQPLILDALDADKLGVSLTDSGIMLPEKTVTALLGRF